MENKRCDHVLPLPRPLPRWPGPPLPPRPPNPSCSDRGVAFLTSTCQQDKTKFPHHACKVKVIASMRRFNKIERKFKNLPVLE